MPVSTRDLNEQRSPGAALARPSLIDRWLRFVQRQRAPYWFTYLILFILESALIHALSWLDGWLPRFTFEPLLLLFPLWLWGPLTILTWLNQTATSVVPDFGRLLELDEEGVERAGGIHHHADARRAAERRVLGGDLCAAFCTHL